MLMLVASTAWGQTEKESSQVHLREYEQQLEQLQKLAETLEQIAPHRSTLLQLLQNSDPDSALIPLLEDLPTQEAAQPTVTATRSTSAPLMVSGVFVPSDSSRASVVVLTKAGRHYQFTPGSTVRVEDKTYRLAQMVNSSTTGIATYTIQLQEIGGDVINLQYPAAMR